jgi:hypothetical protein
MKNNIKNSCGKRGCEITLLPSDSKIKQVNSKNGATNKIISLLSNDSRAGVILSGVHETKYDIQKVLSLATTSLDKELEKEGQMEKMVA